MRLTFTAVLPLWIGLCAAKVYFEENFDDGNKALQSRWKSPKTPLKNKAGEEIPLGKWEISAGTLKTTEDNHYYELTSKLPTAFSNEGKDLVVQMTVRHAQQIDCGGGYIKLLPKDVDQDTFNGDASYYVMFGPDICGTNRKVHVIWIYKETNFMLKKDIPVSYDTITHCYTLVVKPDQTYEVLIDMKKVAFGGLTEDWDILPPNKIKDPKAQKPADYVDEKEIDDVEDKKPVDWDVPEFLADSEDTKPDTWDDEMDGEWKPTQKKNPAYKGEWKPRRVKNPDYQGPWVAPLIDNPDYFTDDSIYVLKNIGAVGFDLWQVKSGTMFDNILITDDLEYAKKVAAENWEPLYNKEKEEMEEQSRIRREEFEKEQQSRKEGAAANSAKDAAEDAAENADSEDTESKEEL